MTRSEEILQRLDRDELAILLLCFSKPNVMEALRIYHKISRHGKKVFYDEGKKQMVMKNLVISEKSELLNP